MRKYQKAVVVLAMLGTAGFLGTGVSQADEPQAEPTNTQNQYCGNETYDGLINIGRVEVNILAIPIASPKDDSHTTTCTNGIESENDH